MATLIIVVPGPDTALVTKNALLHGRRMALGAALGVCAGLSVWTVATALGLASLISASQLAFTALRLLGAAYLIWLGVQALMAARRRASERGGSRPVVRSRAGAWTGFRQGVISNVANPKIAAFFVGLLPQFVTPGRPTLVPFLALGGVFATITVVWLCGYALAAARAAALLSRPRVRAVLDRITGVVLIGLGLRLALERR